MTVNAATAWTTNADMILDVVKLGYIKPNDTIIDLTWGRGTWWKKYPHPGQFTANDADTINMTTSGMPAFVDHKTNFDYRALPDGWTNTFNVTVFDPPYISTGGRGKTSMPDFYDRYGLYNAASTPDLLHADNMQGLTEATRITKPGGLLLVKCAPYISSGVRQEGDWWCRDFAVNSLQLAVHDMLIHLGSPRPQPAVATCRKCNGTGFEDADPTAGIVCKKCSGSGGSQRQQRHARNNYSVLFVFKKGMQ